MHKHLCKLRKKLRRLKSRMKAWGNRVVQRATREPGYIEAVASLGAVFVDLFCGSRAVRRLAYKAAHAVVVLLDILRSPDEGPAWS